MPEFDGPGQLERAAVRRQRGWTKRPGPAVEPGEFVDLDCIGPDGASVRIHKFVERDGQAWALGRARLPEDHPAYRYAHSARLMAATPVELRMRWQRPA
jgi:hypothetical protein